MAKFDPVQLAGWAGGFWRNGIPGRVEGVCADSRKIKGGDLFVAIRGKNFDGHDFVPAAFSGGASGALVSAGLPEQAAPGPLLMVQDTAAALRQMAAGYRRSLGARIVAVTGSVGKTTVKEMVASVFARRMATAKTIGNWNNEFGLPLSMLGMDPGAAAGIFELGVSHPGELPPLARLLAPDWGIITNIGCAHIEYFGTEQAVADEKSALLRCLPGGGLAFVWRDQRWFEALKSAAACRVIAIGEHEDSDYRLLGHNPESLETKVLEKHTGDVCAFRAPLPGQHVALNALFAVAAGRAGGLDWQTIREGLESCRAQPMRWQSEEFEGVRIINDAYNANPVSMAAALKTFAFSACAGRKWLVLAGMHELGALADAAHAELGAAVARLPRPILLAVGPLGSKIADAAEKAGLAGNDIYRCSDHRAAAAVLAGSVRAGDAVLFKASRCERLEKVLEAWKAAARAAPSGRARIGH